MKKQELIKLATDKGFISKAIGKSVDSKSIEKDFYYLWMCELQKWLRDVHKIHVSLFADYDRKDITYNTYWNCNVILLNWGDDREHRIVKPIREFYNSYESALEEGLFQALSI